MKKIIALTLMLMMLASTVCFAAVSSSGSKSSSSGGSKSSTSAPATSPSKTATPSSGNGAYKPSAPASSYSDKAPAKQTTPSVQQNTQPQSSGSSFWRNASLFGGGMLAGSMLGSLFGYNHMGGGSSLFGMLFNLLLIGGVIMGIRFLWGKYKNKDRDMR